MKGKVENGWGKSGHKGGKKTRQKVKTKTLRETIKTGGKKKNLNPKESRLEVEDKSESWR